MSSVLREQFVKLHSQDLLKDLKAQIGTRLPQYKDLLTEPPIIGDLDLELVKEAEYFFN